jgi:hypothetical protein
VERVFKVQLAFKEFREILEFKETQGCRDQQELLEFKD